MQRKKIASIMSGVLLIFLFIFSSCMTSNFNSSFKNNNTKNSSKDLKTKEQNLTEKELSDITLWKTTEQGLFVQSHIEIPSDSSVRAYNPNIASYEGFRMASMLGLDTEFTTGEMCQFLKALFDDMPIDVETGALLKSIVVSDWYDDGSPLVINVTRAFTGDKVPTVVYMFNTWDNLRNYGLPLIKMAGIAYEYPRLKTPEGEFKQEFMDSYMMSWFEDGFITASNAVGKDLPSFKSVEEDFEKLNLTDDYLRDGVIENDDEVKTVLLDIIERDDLKPIGKVFARLQLFMFYLFHEEIEQAQFVIDELNDSGLLENSEIAETEVGILAKRDLQRILDIAIMLSN